MSPLSRPRVWTADSRLAVPLSHHELRLGDQGGEPVQTGRDDYIAKRWAKQRDTERAVQWEKAPLFTAAGTSFEGDYAHRLDIALCTHKTAEVVLSYRPDLSEGLAHFSFAFVLRRREYYHVQNESVYPRPWVLRCSLRRSSPLSALSLVHL